MGAPWLKVLAAALLAAIIAAAGAGKLRGMLEDDESPAQLAALAAQVRPGEVVLYTTSDCLYCNIAKEWLRQRHFPYSECDMSVSQACVREYEAYGARGTPFLVVCGEQMREGFQAAVFVKILKHRPS
jgi:glutaredoxin